MEKVAKCTLQNDVSPNNDERVQGDFNCEVTLEKSEYDNVNFTDPESIKISPNNDEIGGISDLENDEASPLATDKAIKETKEAQENGKTLTELAECVDYYLEENKRIIPPAFEILELVGEQECERKGKIRIRGVFSSPITKQMHFFLPLSFPSSQIKCKVDEAQAGEEVEIICKIQKEFKKATSFVIEERVIKNKRKEMVFIKSKSLDFFSSPFSCDNYNNAKLEMAKNRMNANVTFLQMKLGELQGDSRPLPAYDYCNWDMCYVWPAMSYNGETVYANPYNTSSVYMHEDDYYRELLAREYGYKFRQLDDGSLISVDTKFNCKVKSRTSIAFVMNCRPTEELEITPIRMQLITDDIDSIAGIPEDLDPDKLQNTIDFTNPENLKLIDNLPFVVVTSVDDDNCEEDGTYTVKGKVYGGVLNDYKNVEIPFSSPDSTGLCDITVKNQNVTMNCHIKEKFDISSIIFEPCFIKNVDNNIIFLLNGYSNQKRFACSISVYSEITDPNSTSTNTSTNTSNNTSTNSPTSTSNINHVKMKKNSGGLSGGAIAAIVICSVAVLAITGVIISLVKSGKFSKKETISRNSSTVKHLSINV